jgi:hypothetical protein
LTYNFNSLGFAIDLIIGRASPDAAFDQNSPTAQASALSVAMAGVLTFIVV